MNKRKSLIQTKNFWGKNTFEGIAVGFFAQMSKSLLL